MRKLIESTSPTSCSERLGSPTGDPTSTDQRDTQIRRLPDAQGGDLERNPPRTRHRRRDPAAKGRAGKDLFKCGTSRVDDTLLRAGLVDEIRVWVMPVVVGTGQRLFEDTDTSSLQLTLTDVHELDNGSVILTYTPAYGT